MATTSKDRARGVLIVVMGTSGTGKSTLGISLSRHFDVPFIDGDDLHPQSNVDKMSHGTPLDDADRLPWLLRIRHAAHELTSVPSSPTHASSSAIVHQAEAERRQEAQKGQRAGGHEEHKESVRQMAETLETSHQPDADPDHLRKATPGGGGGGGQHPAQPADGASSSGQPRRACLIACSALKRKYRDLLRSHLQNDTYPQDPTDPSYFVGECLDVFFLYIRVPEEELLRRMHERKAHFMKESMLRSQLEQTLEEPHEDAEPGILTLDGQGPKADVERRAEDLIRERVGPICRSAPSS
ncbi:hypothetical protein OC842_003417 [Tilletia horrida]|uniref:gluconokinase n=1 Tax=Tilletia horrida TaxID=155126 RepID=A0AAN6GBR0_9BASI|nr:hypothetical protein OC842_003417 [Tilletia horrida]